MKDNNIVFALAGALIAVSVMTAFTTFKTAPTAVFGSASENSFNEIPTATAVTIGSDIDTELVATNTARVYLEISNISGAQGIAQTLYCNTNGRAATLYSGFVLHASTTPARFDLSNLYRGALHCKFPVATATVTVLER